MTVPESRKTQDRTSIFTNAKRIVVKVGSAVLADQNGLNQKIILELSSQIADLRSQGRAITLVSSGAIAAGKTKLARFAPVRNIPEKQALAALGQSRLMQAYEDAFERYGIHVAQVLVTRDGLIPRHRYINAKNTLMTLLRWNILPVVNENDTVAVEELQFTDNDALSVLVLNLIEGDLLVCLSDVDGLYSSDPHIDPSATRISSVSGIGSDIFALAGDRPGRAGRGGMRSKLEVARMANACGLPMVVAGGRTKNVLRRLFEGEELGTVFYPSERRRVHGRKTWIAFALKREGVLDIDAGAAAAILKRGCSLLPVGVKKVHGSFDPGACVVCRSPIGEEIAVGISNYSSDELEKILGCQTGEICDRIGHHGEEVIHRDNMFIF